MSAPRAIEPPVSSQCQTRFTAVPSACRVIITPNPVLWQRNYYEHNIRNDDDLRCIREYICDNPLRWSHDRENSPLQ
jgi:hypothetical protein